MRLIVATKNKGKLREIKAILKGIDVVLVSLEGLGRKFRIVENGKTFLQNASKKALAVSRIYKSDYVLGEDSGLEVACLRNRPGIYSKRYAGKYATDTKNNIKLLNAVKDVPPAKRGAQYVCCLVLAKAGEVIDVFEGKLCGSISRISKGEGGFGYDPVFYLSQYKKTVAQLPLSVKNRISHRAKAFQKLKKYLNTCRRKNI
jgi:XTP/dITP diphosphohydrolase